MIDGRFATRDRAMSAPNVPEPISQPTLVSQHYGGASGDLRRPLALWVYVARGLGRIILSVLALPFV